MRKETGKILYYWKHSCLRVTSGIFLPRAQIVLYNCRERGVVGEMIMATGGSFLRNKYWVLRHGKSIPNEKGLIVSSLELKEKNIPLDNVRICNSPFSRTIHTAKVAASALDVPFEVPNCKVMEELQERYFGPSFEPQSHDKYSEIWELDAKDPFLPPEGGQSLADVVSRLAKAVASLETEFQGCAILIVSHGDPMQILQTILHAANQHTGDRTDDFLSSIQAITVFSVLSEHQQFALNTGELRSIL